MEGYPATATAAVSEAPAPAPAVAPEPQGPQVPSVSVSQLIGIGPDFPFGLQLKTN